jgi:hypothetical protein
MILQRSRWSTERNRHPKPVTNIQRRFPFVNPTPRIQGCCVNNKKNTIFTYVKLPLPQVIILIQNVRQKLTIYLKLYLQRRSHNLQLNTLNTIQILLLGGTNFTPTPKPTYQTQSGVNIFWLICNYLQRRFYNLQLDIFLGKNYFLMKNLVI